MPNVPQTPTRRCAGVYCVVPTLTADAEPVVLTGTGCAPRETSALEGARNYVEVCRSLPKAIDTRACVCAKRVVADRVDPTDVELGTGALINVGASCAIASVPIVARTGEGPGSVGAECVRVARVRRAALVDVVTGRARARVTHVARARERASHVGTRGVGCAVVGAACALINVNARLEIPQQLTPRGTRARVAAIAVGAVIRTRRRLNALVDVITRRTCRSKIKEQFSGEHGYTVAITWGALRQIIGSDKNIRAY